LQLPGAQVIAEPGHDQADAFDRRGHGLQPVQRHDDVGGVGDRVQVLGHGRAAGAGGFLDRGGRIGELARGRDHRHRLDQPLGGVGIGQRPEHLEADLRQAVAEGAEVQFLEDDIGGAAIGGVLAAPILAAMNGSGAWPRRPDTSAR
jgi:hypothetical protein